MGMRDFSTFTFAGICAFGAWRRCIHLVCVKPLREIGDAARRMNVPIRVLYTSNAEEYMRFPEPMRKNLLGLPVDQKSVIIRTTTTGTRQELGWPDGEKFPETFPFHYNIQPMTVFHVWLARGQNFRLLDMIRHSRKLQKGLSVQEKTPDALGLN